MHRRAKSIASITVCLALLGINAASQESGKQKRVSAPIPLYTPDPEYTPEARKAKLEGIVRVRCVVELNGRVSECTVTQSLGMGLDESAVNTIRSQWKFSPAKLDKKPVRVMIAVEVPFHLYPIIP